MEKCDLSPIDFREGSLNVFYWIDGKFGYALSAGMEREELTTVLHRTRVLVREGVFFVAHDCTVELLVLYHDA